MKIDLNEVRNVVERVVTEAKRKKKDPIDPPELQAGYGMTDAHQLNVPMGSRSLARRQGQSGIGPYTAEAVLRAFVRSAIVEILERDRIMESKAFRNVVRRGSR